MKKSPDAFRTISEVADWLDVPAHVLRFWESRFSQIKPVKRAGGRRYYRPSDMELLGGIKRLLHDDGMTIRGVQKLLREEGIRHVAGFSPALDDEIGELAGAEAAHDMAEAAMAVDVAPEPIDNVVHLDRPGTAPAAEPPQAEPVIDKIKSAPQSTDIANDPADPSPEVLTARSPDDLPRALRFASLGRDPGARMRPRRTKRIYDRLTALRQSMDADPA